MKEELIADLSGNYHDHLIGVRLNDRAWWLWQLDKGRPEETASNWRRGPGWRIGATEYPAVSRFRAHLLMGNSFLDLAKYLRGPLI